MSNRNRPELFYENTVEGRFVRRLNRFTAEVEIDGVVQEVHVKNTGRLGELLVPKAKVTLQQIASETRATAYDLISVYKPRLKWVNIDSLAPNALMKQFYAQAGYDLVKPEFTYGNSRFDFYMERRGTKERGVEKYLSEVKGCTLAAPIPGFGLFPDAPTERGVKHLNELAEAAANGYHCSIDFVIQMNGIRQVNPNDETQPEFRQALIHAVKAGVEVVCHGCHVEADRIWISSIVGDTQRFKNR